MRVLVTGRGSGSWKIRGEQLGSAIGGIVEANTARMNGFDVAILIKRPRSDTLSRLTSKPIVWDVVDAWPQPEGNNWNRERCLKWLREQVSTIRPSGIVAATKAMAEDCAEFGIPVLWLPHHARPGQAINPIREKVVTVGYEGGEQYLGRWRPFLEVECARRGWRFVVNPASLADLDIAVAVREATGYAVRSWKSGIKLANAQGSGTPIVCNREAGYLERGDGALWADDEAEMRGAFDYLADPWRRTQAAGTLLAAEPKLDAVATTYKKWLLSKFC
jgi:hypothetical protein